MIYWSVVGGEVMRSEAAQSTRIETAYGGAMVVNTVDPHIYVAMSPKQDLLVFRAFLLKAHAEETLANHRKTFKHPISPVAEEQEPEVPETWEMTKKFPNDNRQAAVGDVYPCKGGGKTRYWVVVAIVRHTAVLLGFGPDGEVTSSINYGVHVLAGHAWSRRRVGVVKNMRNLRLKF